MVDQIFIVFDSGGDLAGGSYHSASAEEWAKELGGIVTLWTRNDDGSWEIDDPQGAQNLPFKQGVEKERARIIHIIKTYGINSQSLKAIKEGYNLEGAAGLFKDRKEGRPLGPQGSPRSQTPSSQPAPGPQVEDPLKEWEMNRLLRMEFRGDLACFLAYKKAERQGLVCR